MSSFLAFTVAILFLSAYTCIKLQALRHNINQAKLSSLQYHVLPLSPFALPWLFVQPFLVPALCRLPRKWTQPWLALLQFTRAWHYGYAPFRDAGADTFMAVFPSGSLLFTCDPEVSLQFLRSPTVGKPLELLALLNIFGPHITGSDGQEARLYRRITAPFFREDIMHRVWDTSVSAAGSLLKLESRHRNEMRPVLARMTLHILNELCFEYELDSLYEYPGQQRIHSGHKMSYSQAMAETLEYLPTIFLTPPIILSENLHALGFYEHADSSDNSPLPSHRKARRAYNELRGYMAGLRDRKEKDIESNQSVVDSSLLDAIVRANKSFDTNFQPQIQDSSVLGNIFVFMFAGHEASANTLHFLFVLLACHPDVQALLYADIKLCLGSSLPTSWSYEAHFSALSTSYVGAVINETLRLFGVLPYLPKTSPPNPWKVNSDEGSHLLPPNTLVLVNTAAIHNNPALWPLPCQELSTTTEAQNPVASFNPARWLDQCATKSGTRKDQDFFHPPLGTYLPFSDGTRGCLGRKFALVELVAIIAVIFYENKVELAVGYPENATEHERKRLWEKARTKAEYEMSEGVEFKLSLRLSHDIPLRFIKRSKEKLV